MERLSVELSSLENRDCWRRFSNMKSGALRIAFSLCGRGATGRHMRFKPAISMGSIPIARTMLVCCNWKTVRFQTPFRVGSNPSASTIQFESGDLMRYLVRCQWTMQGNYHIKADSARDAVDKVRSALEQAPVLPVDNWLAAPLEIISVCEKKKQGKIEGR